MSHLSVEFLEPYKTRKPPIEVTGMIVYKRTYSRNKTTDGKKEEWWETCAREVNSIMDLGLKLTRDEMESLYDACFNLKCSFSGRAKWQLGTPTVERIGGASMNNCWGVVVDTWKSFVFTFDMLMLGGGVGFNIQRENVYQIPKVKSGVVITRKDTNDADFIVPDSREGWIELLSRTMQAFFETGKGFSYSTVCVRGKGVPIKGFGGISSGPEDLCIGLQKICNVINNRAGKKIRPIDALDIMDIVAEIVVSGNCRRSALLGLGDIDDVQFLNAKRWELGNIPNWRKNSNNTIICNDIKLLSNKYWNNFKKDPNTGMAKGEIYGLMNMNLSRRKGRVLDCHRVDPDVYVCNPCAEITLSSIPGTGEGESCNLFTLFLSRMNSKEEFIKNAKLGYKVVKTIASLRYHWENTNKLIKENMRLGISVSGICEWLPKLPREEAANWLDSCYKELEYLDASYSQDNGFCESIKLTTVQPSGSLSKIPHTSPGVHPFYAAHYIQRIRFASDDPLVKKLRDANYHTEYQMEFDGSLNTATVVVSFPMKSPAGSLMAKDMTAVDQLELVKFMNIYWSDNSTSVTVYYKEEELDSIKEWLYENYNDYIKSVSFLLHSDHGFKQAPMEEIDEETYLKMSKGLKEVSFQEDSNQYETGNDECSTGACPIK